MTFAGREANAEYEIAPEIVARIYESDPMWMAVFVLNGVPVLGESCIVDLEKWLNEARNDAALLERIRS